VQDELSCIIDALAELVWTALPDGQVDFVNQRWPEYTGLSAEESSGWGWQAAFHPADLSGLLEQWQVLLASDQPGEIEARLRNVEGAYRRFVFRVRPLLDGSGQVMKWCGVNTDVQDRRRAEEAFGLGENDLRSVVNLRSVIDTIPMTAWSTRADGYCDFCNQRWLDYAGLTLDQVQGWGWEAVIHPDDLGALMKNWQSCLASGTPVKFEARMRRFDGVYRWFLFLGNPLRDESGNIVKWFGTRLSGEK
jgi:PAS domain S-box-containing protein